MVQRSVPGTTGVLTFLFSDIEGSSSRWERSPEAMQRALAQHDAILESAVRNNAGRVFKKVGDAFCCAFDTPRDAVQAAIDAQRELAAAPWPPEIGGLRVRMGVHSGSALQNDDGDFAGPALNRVSRLTAAGHGGQVLLSAACAALLRDGLPEGASLRSLGDHRLRDLSHHETLFQLEAPGLIAEFPKPKALDTHPNNLPAPISSFVGRSSELSALSETLRSVRLIAIAGPGGIGKTRLGLQAAAQAAPLFEDGCWLIKLAGIKDTQFIASAAAAVLQVRETPGRALADSLIEHLRFKHLLLILDNCEHVIAGVAQTVARILQECAHVTVLLTTREPAHLRGEHVFRLESLPEPDAQLLFRERAQSVGGTDPAGSSQGVAAICRQLDGIPLAIELAAARTQTLTADEIASALQRGMKLLISKDPLQEERHRTLSATIAWSFALLDPDEQQLLRRLCVFDGGFTFEAAEAVCTQDGDPLFLDRLDSLIDKSFVAVSSAGALKRFRLLEPIRNFLTESTPSTVNDDDDTREKHFVYYHAFVADHAGRAKAAEAALIDLDIENVRSALGWGIERTAEIRAVADFVKRMVPYWQLRGIGGEARAWLARSLAVPALEIQERAMLLRYAATFATMDDDYAAARSFIGESLQLFGSLQDAAGIAEATEALAVLEHYTGNLDEADRLYGDALQRFEHTENPYGIIAALTNRSMILAERGRLDGASALLERAAETSRTAEMPDLLASVLSHQASLEIQRKLPAQALLTYTEALAIKRQLHSHTDLTDILAAIAYANVLLGQSAAALEYAQLALHEALDVDSKAALVIALEIVAVVLFRTGSKEESRSALSASAALRAATGHGFESLSWPDDLSEIRSSCEAAAFETLVKRAASQDVRAIANGLFAAALADAAK